jgi:DNA-binding NarL/FixJ family response regulator
METKRFCNQNNKQGGKTMSRPIRLIIADDHILIREGLLALLNGEPDFIVLDQASNGKEALHLIRKHCPDIAILDISLPDYSGLEVAEKITNQMPHVKSLILTMHEEETFFYEALQAGVAGYVLKSAKGDELLTAIRAIYQDGTYLPPKLISILVQEYLRLQPKPTIDDKLTPREYDVLLLIAQGFSNKDVGKKLTLSLNTIKTHRSNIYQKLNLSDRASLIAYAQRKGLLIMQSATMI